MIRVRPTPGLAVNDNTAGKSIMLMVVRQSSLLASSCSSIRACSKVCRSQNVSDLKLGPRLGFAVNNNAAAGMGVTLFL